MKYTNIFEKIICIANLIQTNWIYLAFLLLVALLLLLLTLKKISKKTCFITTLIGYIALLATLIIRNSNELNIIKNSIVDNLFMNIYFPSTYTYLFTLVVIDVITITSLLNNKMNKIYQIIHGTFFIIIHFILTIILETLSKNQIDIFTKTSLFSNKDLIILLEFSMNIFIMWIIITIFAYITNVITEKITLSEKKKEITYDNTITTNTLETNIQLPEEEEETPQPITQPKWNMAYESVPTIPTTYITENTETLKEETPQVETIHNEIIPEENDNTTYETEPLLTVNPIPTQKNYDELYTMNQTNNETNIPTFNLEEFIPKQQEVLIPEPIIENTKIEQPTVEETIQTDNYTLNDYRIFNQMLKEIKEHNQNNTVTIDKNLEYRLITKYSTEKYNMFKQMLKIYSH